MSNQTSASGGIARVPLRIAGVYTLVGLLWIWLSDTILIWLGLDTDQTVLVGAIKGTVYVAVTAALLGSLVRREVSGTARSESLLRAVVEGTTDAVFVKDLAGRYLLVNEATAKFIGRPVSEVLGRDDRELFEAADAERLMADDRVIMANGKVVTFDESITSSGKECTYLSTKAPLLDADGTVIGIIGVSRDITERKATEDALRDSEERYRALANAIPQIVWTAGPDGAITHLNQKAFEYSGLEMADLAGWSWERVIHPDDIQHAVSQWRLVLQDGLPRAFKMRIRQADGEYRWHIARQLPIRNPEGVIESWVGTCTDIDNLSRTETVLRETETRLREAQRIALLGSWNWEFQTNKVSWSDAEFELFGLEPGSLTPSLESFLSILHPDDRAIALDRVESMKAGGSEFANDLRIVRPDGSYIWIHSRARTTRDSEGRLVRVEGTDQDITGRRLAEEALRASESRYRLLFESNPHPMWVYNTDSFRFVAVNNAAVLAYGYSREEFLAMSIRDIRPPDEILRLESEVSALPHGPSPASLWRHKKKDGTVFYVDVSSHDLPDAGGCSRLVMALDVTDRLMAERELRSERDRFEKVMEAVPVAICSLLLAPDGHVSMPYASPRIEPIYGIPPAALASDAHAFFSAIHAEDIERVQSSIAESAETLTLWRDEFRVHSPVSGEIWIEGCSAPVRLADGSVLWHGYVADVTARKKVVDALRESERQLRLVLDSAGAVAFRWDIRNDTVTHFFRTKPAFPVTAEQLGTLDEVRALVHPDDLSGFDARLSECLAGETEYRNQFRAVRSDGVIVTLEEYGYLDRAADGSPLFLTGISIDVSDRVAATEALRESEERYRRLVAVLPTAVLIHNGDRVLYSNPAFLRLIGAQSADEVLNQPAINFIHADDRPLLPSGIADISATGETVTGQEIRFSRVDGRLVPTYSVSTPITGYGPHAFLVAVTDLTERERATQLLRSVLSSVGDAILTINEHGVIGSANPAAITQFGYTEDELIGLSVTALMQEQFVHEHEGYLFSYLKTGVPKVIGFGREVGCRRRDGSLFTAELTVTEFSLDGERRFTGVLRDITERQRLQSQFIQAQKMEAVGRLAGGVAHDFNNLLTIISGYCELLLMSDFPVGDSRRESIVTIRDAGERAARLTQQLLAFSRKAVIEPKLMDLNELVTDSAKLLRRLIGEDIILAVVTTPKPIPIKVDPGQLEQVIMNLVVNARDAMPTGGRLTIETSTCTSADSSSPQLARLSISDTGQGMSDEVKEKIFEPFFTTKAFGKGTGLGLPVVHGVVTQSGGRIEIESTPGVGTTFRILLPLITDAIRDEVADPTQYAIRGSETVLLVEDDSAVRKITRISLQTHGYKVLEASDGESALRAAEKYPAEIHLLITDVVMPEMGGLQLVDSIRRQRPGLRVLFMSGYTDDAVLLHGVSESTGAFIQKPFTPLSLAQKVREVIDSPRV